MTVLISIVMALRSSSRVAGRRLRMVLIISLRDELSSFIVTSRVSRRVIRVVWLVSIATIRVSVTFPAFSVEAGLRARVIGMKSPSGGLVPDMIEDGNG